MIGKVKKCAFFLLLIQLFSLFLTFAPVRVSASELPDTGKVRSVYVYNADTDVVLYEKASDARVYPASTVKMMTGLIAVEHFKGDYDRTVVITDELLGGFKGRKIGLKNGEVVTVRDLIYATVCGGANDAANVLAALVSENHDDFIELMNDRAAGFGMENTHYTNAYGFADPGMYTTAQDVLKLALVCKKNDTFMTVCSAVSYNIPETNMNKERYVFNSNYLISGNVEKQYRNAKANGMNAGSTEEQGTVLVTTTSQNGVNNVYVLLGGEYDDDNLYAYRTANALIKWADDSFGYRRIVDKSEMIREVRVNLSSNTDYVIISPERSIEYYLPADTNIEKAITREITLESEEFDAPIEAGQQLGYMVVKYQGKEIGSTPLVAKASVDRNGFLYLLARIKTWTHSENFRLVIIVAVAILALWAIISVYKKLRPRRR